MVFKEPGNTKKHKLRVIHLHEADLNLILGVKWRALTHHGIDNHLFSPWQFGGLPGRDALTPVFLEQFQRTTELDSIPTTITKEEWVGKMKVWNEATTTSPSGLHLGHRKCLIREIDIPQDRSLSDDAIEALNDLESNRKKMLDAQITLINHAITRKHVFERWKKVANFMIFKEPGNTKIHRLRVRPEPHFGTTPWTPQMLDP